MSVLIEFSIFPTGTKGEKKQKGRILLAKLVIGLIGLQKGKAVVHYSNFTSQLEYPINLENKDLPIRKEGDSKPLGNKKGPYGIILGKIRIGQPGSYYLGNKF